MSKRLDTDKVALHNAICRFLEKTWQDDYNGDYCIDIIVDGQTFTVSMLDVDISLDDDGLSADIILSVDNDLDDPSHEDLLTDADLRFPD